MTVNREQFGSKLGFILAAAGSAVGIGNIVGFPVNAAKNGGAVFLVIYALFVAFICLPVMMAEMSAGRSSQRNPLGAYKVLSGGNGFWSIGGWLSTITPFMIAVFYQVITVWIFGYLVASLTGNLTKIADPGYFGEFINQDLIFGYMAFMVVLIGFVLNSGVQKGIERVAKILMPLLIVMLVALVIYVLTLENAMQGVKYYLIPDMSKLSPEVVSGALGQAFFSLSLGMGILITYGSYISKKESIADGAKMVAITDTGVAFSAGLLILPAIFALNPGTNTAELSDSSISLIFSFLPKIFLALQADIGYTGASIFSSVFFLLVFFAALTSQISILQVPLSALQDEKCWSRAKSLLVLGLLAVFFVFACTVSFGKVGFFTTFVNYAGLDKSFFDVVIDIFYDTILPLNGFIICLFVITKWKKQQFNNELEVGDANYKGSFLQRYVNFSLSTFIPVVLFLIFINTLSIKFFGMSLI